MDTSQSLIIAHRGESVLMPENTIAGCQSALDSGATGLEVDIRMCASGELVLFHDKTLIRHFNKYKPICLCSWNELKKLNYTSQNSSKNFGIVLLKDFLEEFKNTVPLILDVKTLCGRHIRIVKALIRMLEKLNMIDQIWVSAFDPIILTILKKLRPNIRTGFLFSRFTLLYQSLDMMLNSDSWHAHYNLVNDKLMETAQKLGKQIFIWTINDLNTLEKYSKYQFEGIITDSLYKENLSEIVIPSQVLQSSS